MSGSDDDQETKSEEIKSKQRSRGKKRKRVASESSSDEDALPENTLEVEKSLHASAIKNNLDDVSVKKILKKVVTNDHVLALVKLREEEEDSGTDESLRPKLTRAKVKELLKVSPKSGPWSLELTPIKHIPVKTRPEVTALIAQDLPEDEDDEEYEPTNDDVPSDDDHMLESSSDLDSLPRTPATPRSQKKATPKVVNDGPFKVPQQELSTPVRRKLVLEEEATIALRTRSKLSLSATSIEHIESSFVPPDDLPVPDVDSLWKDFLKDCLNPASNARNEDDDEADPEYNVAADPDAVEEDEESLENSIIKISKKELSDLVTELFSIIPEETTEQLADNIVQDVLTEHPALQTGVTARWEGKQEPVSDEDNTTVTSRPAPIAAKRERMSIGKCEPEQRDDLSASEQGGYCTNDSIQQEPISTSAPVISLVHAVEPRIEKPQKEQPPPLLRSKGNQKLEPIRIEIRKGTCCVTAEQVLLLQQQVRQHVQLATGIYLQLFTHPVHWARAPKYKEYLVSLNQMVEKNPASVVNVCNLKQALELANSWEESVSENSEDNIKMVEFVQKELERSQRRMAQNAYYVGSFPERYMQVVANSTVFLYPRLLPATPFRPDYSNRRASYLPSEDKLITLGLDQFWDYVSANPAIYKPPAKVHPRHRWGLGATVGLVCKYLVPWLPMKTLLAHVRHAKKGLDKDNPIYKFFMSREVEPVKHRLLPYNPQLTLYEQPEHEIPRIWIRYLAKISRRFKKHLQGRAHKSLLEECPGGVDIEVNLEAPSKKPLPIDFTKEINCHRLNLLPAKPEVNLVNRIDLPINANTTLCQPLIVSDIFTVLSTSTGSFLVPLQMQTKTVECTTTPICTPAQASLNDKVDSNGTADTVASAGSDEIEGTKTAEISVPDSSNSENAMDIQDNISPEHCNCCLVIRNICRRKQRTIVDYFSGDGRLNPWEKCQCKGRRYPRMTNRLNCLLRNYKLKSQCVFQDLQSNLSSLRQELCDGVDKKSVIIDDDENDLAIATLYQLKLTTRTTVIRNNIVKRYIHKLFSTFDMLSGDVCSLVSAMLKHCEPEMMDLFKEFIGFLTAEQADKVGHFKHYFIHRCMENLIKKIECVPDIHKKIAIMTFLKSRFFATAFQSWSACDICTALLKMTVDYPALAQYVYSLFPHRFAQSDKQQDSVELENPSSNTETAAEAAAVQDTEHEADHTSSAEEVTGANVTLNDGRQFVNEHENIPVKIEEEEIVDVVNASKKNAMTSEDCAMDDDTAVKTESPEWKRDEDKVILEVLQQHIAEHGNETIMEILEETEVLTMLADSLPHKTVSEVKERIVYLLQLLLTSDQ